MDKKNLWIALGTLILCQVAPGCIWLQVTKLPAFEMAGKMARPDHPKLFFRESLNPQDMPSCQPFAEISARAGEIASKEGMVRRIWTEGASLGADLIVVQDGGQVFAGSISTYWGFGVVSTQPIENQILIGTCLKVPAARVGLLDDESGMVTALIEGGHLQEAGIIEGDKIMSVDGVPWDTRAQNSGLFPKLLSLQPDQEVNLVWIRQGTGRMVGKAKCMPNPPIHLQIADSIPWEGVTNDSPYRDRRRNP